MVGHPIVFDNKAGASGIVGAKAVINAAPDGYTLLVSAVTSVIIPPSMTSPPAFDPLRDLVPVTGIGTVPAVLVVHPGKGIRTFAELLQYARANPGKVNLASSGAGTIAHLAGELLMRETGIKIVPVHYRGGAPAVTDLLGGHADIMFSDAPFFLEHIRAGMLVPLAVGTRQRAPSLPDVPTTAELGFPAIVASNTYSLFAPRGTPPAVVDRLYQLMVTALRDPEVRAAFAGRRRCRRPMSRGGLRPSCGRKPSAGCRSPRRWAHTRIEGTWPARISALSRAVLFWRWPAYRIGTTCPLAIHFSDVELLDLAVRHQRDFRAVDEEFRHLVPGEAGRVQVIENLLRARTCDPTGT